jgi:hypothetical protein
VAISKKKTFRSIYKANHVTFYQHAKLRVIASSAQQGQRDMEGRTRVTRGRFLLFKE